jgi:transketolase
MPVKICGMHAGVSVGADGATHQMLEDIGMMRMLPNMIVLNPCDTEEARKAVIAAAKIDGPVYIRFGRAATPIFTTPETPFEIGKSELFWASDSGTASVGIIATGSLLYEALLAAKELEDEGVMIKVINLASIKPIDEKTIIELAKETGALVTVEEHQIAGGVGSAVAEVLTQNFPVPIEFVGVKDIFGQSGTPEELIEHYSLDKNAIKEAVRKVLKRKSC